MAPEPVRLATIGFGQQNLLLAEEYGNKAAGLAALATLGVPVPSAFSLSVTICREYYERGEVLPDDVPSLLKEGTCFLEHATGSIFGGERLPLLVSVRSGAPVSMPGIMNTVLNVGLTPQAVSGLIRKTGNPRFAYDSYRRFLESFGECVFGHDPADYHRLLAQALERQGVPDERELDFLALRELCGQYVTFFRSDEERSCIQDAGKQLLNSTIAVIRSWKSSRALEYQRIHSLSATNGTAVTVQAMVFGNISAMSGAGVAFTRNPWTGKKEVLVDFRFGAQGEDVVSGSRSASTQADLVAVLPDVYHELLQISSRVENAFGDMQDLEFTVQDGRLYILQTRSGKRSALADLQIALDLYSDGIISRTEACRRISTIDPATIELSTIQSDETPLARGISASGGVAQGTIAFSAEAAALDSSRGPVILVRETASPDDIAGIEVSAGILTARGARTSHAAVVARQMGKVCIVNCSALRIEPSRHRCVIGDVTLREGDIISLDGNTGEIYRGKVEVIRKKPEDLFRKILTLCQQGADP